MVLIGISGKKGVGKDLLASYLKRKYEFVNMPFAGALKEGVRNDFGFTREQTDGQLKESSAFLIKSIIPPNAGPEDTCVVKMWTPREIMVEYGQFFRQFDPLWWVKKVFNQIATMKEFLFDERIRVCISDVRFRNEAEYIKSQGGLLVRLERLPELNIYKTVSTDISETDLDNYDGWDFKLNSEDNRVPEDLEKLADDIMADLYVRGQ